MRKAWGFVPLAFFGLSALALVQTRHVVVPGPPPWAAPYAVPVPSGLARGDMLVLCPVEVVAAEIYPTLPTDHAGAPMPRHPRIGMLGTTTTFRNRASGDPRIGAVVSGTLMFSEAAADALIPGDKVCIALLEGGTYYPLLKLPAGSGATDQHAKS